MVVIIFPHWILGCVSELVRLLNQKSRMAPSLGRPPAALIPWYSTDLLFFFILELECAPVGILPGGPSHLDIRYTADSTPYPSSGEGLIIVMLSTSPEERNSPAQGYRPYQLSLILAL